MHKVVYSPATISGGENIMPGGEIFIFMHGNIIFMHKNFIFIPQLFHAWNLLYGLLQMIGQARQVSLYIPNLVAPLPLENIVWIYRFSDDNLGIKHDLTMNLTEIGWQCFEREFFSKCFSNFAFVYKISSEVSGWLLPPLTRQTE